MAQWGTSDAANNSPTWGPALVNKKANTGNQTDLFGNTTSGSSVTGQKVGIFAVDSTEISVSNGTILSINVTSPGSGYFANATVTIGNNATANAQANSLGRIGTVNITAAGNSYSTAPSVTIAAPAGQSFNANTGVAANGFITVASNKFQNDDLVKYLVAAGNTAVVGIANNTNYYVVGANSTGVYLAATANGTAITLTPSATSETGHTLTGQTATATASISGGSVSAITITSPGSGYFANATVTITSHGTANAQANSTGRISTVNVTAAGSGYKVGPNITIAPPSAQSFNANTGVAANGFITVASNKFQVNDKVTYLVAAGNTAVVGISNNTQYFVHTSNSTGVYLKSTATGSAITLTPSATSETGHTLTGETATAVATTSGGKNKGVAHTGWVLRKEGTGGRSGRVQYEVLIAGGVADDGEDTILPDS